MNSFWDERYSEQEFVYGELPNDFFAKFIKTLTPGTIILPCDGEGRNAVYAAKNRWIANAFDQSEAGKIKADQLALKHKAKVDFKIMDAALASFPDASADVVGLIYTHLPSPIRIVLHRNIIKWLKPGGKLVLETFCPDQLKNSSGGPKDVEMLYTKEVLQSDFKDLSIDYLEYVQIELNEGKYHQGKADVIRMIATKR